MDARRVIRSEKRKSLWFESRGTYGRSLELGIERLAGFRWKQKRKVEDVSGMRKGAMNGSLCFTV